VLLLNSNNNEECYENVDIHAPACREQHVLENDVPRTRADVEHFQSDAYQVALKSILQKFCVQHRIEYKQGLNEVLAPFIYMLPPQQININININSNSNSNSIMT
jgi:hypothetical protein